MRRRQSSLQMLMMVLVAMFVTGCAGTPATSEVYCQARSVGYCEALADSNLDVQAVGASGLSRLVAKGVGVEAFEVQAYQAQRLGSADAWRADFLTTVVIIIDRDQTDVVIAGWRDLTEVDEQVSVGAGRGEYWLLISSVEWGLSGELVPASPAFELIADVRRDGRLMAADAAPITIGFDHQAADRIAAGANLEVVVPIEGTLSFRKGLLADGVPLPEQPGLAQRLSEQGYSAPTAAPPEGARLITGGEMPYDGRWLAQYRRLGLGEQLLHTADQVEATVLPLVVVVLLIGWVGSLARRGSQPSVRRAAIGLGGLSVFWLAVRLIKYTIDHQLAGELLWYTYYVAMLGLPLFMLWLAWAVDRTIDNGRPPRWWWLLLGTNVTLLCLVLTNSLHELVFRFPGAGGSEYGYEAGYFVVAAACAIPLLAAVGWLLIKSHRVPGRRLPWLPLLVLVLMVGYVVAYALRIRLLRQTDLTLWLIVLGVLLIEVAVRTRTLPLNTDYEALFGASTLNMRISDAQSGDELAAAGSQGSPPPAINLVEFSAPIRGGQVAWVEDISAITSLQREAALAVERQRRLNEMLQARREAQRQVIAAAVRARLLGEMETEVAARVADLNQLVARLPPGPVEHHALASVGLGVCFVKRRAALFFQLQSGEQIDTDELLRHISELVRLAEPAGLRCAIRMSPDAGESVWRPELLYECVFRLIDHGVSHHARAMVCQIELGPLRQQLDCLLSAEFADFAFDDDLRSRLAETDAELGWRQVDESLALQVSLVVGAGEHV